MDRLTVPDVRVDEHTIRRTFVDAEAVRDRAMEFYWRLKAYEDKELEPEEVLQKDKADEIALKLMRLADLESICSYTRLRELAEFDKDGRLVVLPCKIGDTVWFKTYTDNGKTCIGIQPHKAVSARVCVMAEGRIFPVELPLSRFGKSWFLTREEAEKALEAMENG